MKFHLAILIALSSLLLLNISNTLTYETREILPQTGFWNYLPVFGIWARIVHYLAVDSNGLGNQVKNLDRYFKEKYTPEKYVDLVNRVVNKLPKIEIAYRVSKIKENLRKVANPATGQTLGEAFDIINDLGNDEETVNKIASTLDLLAPDDITMIESSTLKPDYDLKTTLKNTILEKPSIIADALKDPQVVNFVTSSVLQYLSSDQLIHGIESLQKFIAVVESYYPDMYQEGRNPLFDLEDPETGRSFIKTLESLLNIIKNPEFPEEMAKLLNIETMTHLQKSAQDVLSKITQTEPQITAKKFVKIMRSFNVNLDKKTAENLLRASRNKELGEKARQFLTEISQIKDLTPAKVTQFINEKGVSVDEKSVQYAINAITAFPPDMLTEILQEVGLNIPKDQVSEIAGTVNEMKKKYDESHPPISTTQEPNSSTSE